MGWVLQWIEEQVRSGAAKWYAEKDTFVTGQIPRAKILLRRSLLCGRQLSPNSHSLARVNLVTGVAWASIIES
jgi:hypothetical protein